MLTAATAPNLLQAVRIHFGLSFGLLATFLGVSESLLGLAATGRRDLPTAAYLRLQPLAAALPAPWTNIPAEPPAPPLPAPALAGPLPHPLAPAGLRARRAACLHLARGLAARLVPLAGRQAQARRLLAVLPALATAQSLVEEARWLPQFEALAHERLGPGPSTELALGQARRAALLAEAAQLAVWLGE